MENLLEIIKVYEGLKKVMPLVETEQLAKMAIAYVTNNHDIPNEAVLKPIDKTLSPIVQTLREYRIKVGISQEKASMELKKAVSYIGRLEGGKIKNLSKDMEKKILNLYKSLEEKKQETTT